MTQSIFPLTPVKIADGGTNYDWTDIDLSVFGVPAGATGAIVHIHNISSGVRPWGVREKGSTDTNFGDMSGDAHCWGMIGIDANRKLQFKNLTAFPDKVEMYLVGYTKAGVAFFVNGVLSGLGLPNNSWQVLDLSASVPAGALGVIVEVFVNVSGTYNYGLRKNGSSDNRITPSLNKHNQFTAIIGCDTDRKIEIYKQVANVLFYLLGYITDGATFLLNATDITPVPVGSWADLAPLPGGGGVMQGYRVNVAQRFFLTGYESSGLMGFVELIGSGGLTMGLRKKGDTLPAFHPVNDHIWGIAEAAKLPGVGGGGGAGAMLQGVLI